MKEKARLSLGKVPRLWLIFVDDVFGIWKGSKEKFERFVDICDENEEAAMKCAWNNTVYLAHGARFDGDIKLKGILDRPYGKPTTPGSSSVASQLFEKQTFVISGFY